MDGRVGPTILREKRCIRSVVVAANGFCVVSRPARLVISPCWPICLARNVIYPAKSSATAVFVAAALRGSLRAASCSSRWRGVRHRTSPSAFAGVWCGRHRPRLTQRAPKQQGSRWISTHLPRAAQWILMSSIGVQEGCQVMTEAKQMLNPRRSLLLSTRMVCGACRSVGGPRMRKCSLSLIAARSLGRQVSPYPKTATRWSL